MKYLLFFLFLFSFFVSCNVDKPAQHKIVVFIKGANNKKIFLQQVALEGEKMIVLDSLVAKGDYDSLVFHIPKTEERVYKIEANEVGMEISFVNDSPEIHIHANYGNPQWYWFDHSPGSTAVKNFIDFQQSLATQETQIQDSIQKLKKQGDKKKDIDSLDKQFYSLVRKQSTSFIEFEDTISSPGAFLSQYNGVDFDKDYAGLKKFIIKAANRFPNHSIIQGLKNRTLDYIKIFEEEYNIGDTLPSVSLDNSNDLPYNTASLRGKFYLIDFWSTWCPQCMIYMPEKKKLKDILPASKFEIVSVAIDAEKANWKNLIYSNNLNWIQLIDEKMWKGDAVRTLKFDSIPFNFLVSPNGKILAKAIKADSLVKVVSSFVK